MMDVFLFSSIFAKNNGPAVHSICMKIRIMMVEGRKRCIFSCHQQKSTNEIFVRTLHKRYWVMRLFYNYFFLRGSRRPVLSVVVRRKWSGTLVTLESCI